MSGTANNNQMYWIEVQLATAISGGHQLTLQIDPPKPCWSKQLVLDDYLLQPLLIIHPENQHDVKFDLKCLHCVSESCPTCYLVWMTGLKAYSKPHHVHLLDCNASVVLACYQCTTKEWQSTFSILDLSLAPCIPESMLLSCGVQLFDQSTWSLSMLQTMFSLVSGHVDINGFIVIMRNFTWCPWPARN